MFPQVLAQPRTACDPDAVIRAVDGRGSTPEVGVVMQVPTPAVVVGLCRVAASFGAIVDQVEERFVAFSSDCRLPLASSSFPY